MSFWKTLKRWQQWLVSMGAAGSVVWGIGSSFRAAVLVPERMEQRFSSLETNQARQAQDLHEVKVSVQQQNNLLIRLDERVATQGRRNDAREDARRGEVVRRPNDL